MKTNSDKNQSYIFLTLKDLDNSAWNNFLTMEENIEYTFSDSIREKYNKEARKNNFYEPKQTEYQFKRNGMFLSYSYDFGITFRKIMVNQENFALAVPVAAAVCLAVALISNELKKVKEDKDNERISCNGKVVEIDGKKYKLTEVK